jgi:hypothetical protein
MLARLATSTALGQRAGERSAPTFSASLAEVQACSQNFFHGVRIASLPNPYRPLHAFASPPLRLIPFALFHSDSTLDHHSRFKYE